MQKISLIIYLKKKKIHFIKYICIIHIYICNFVNKLYFYKTMEKFYYRNKNLPSHIC